MTEDDAWRQIVENYGDAPSVEEIAAQERRERPTPPPPASAPEPSVSEAPLIGDEDRFVPEVEPLGRPEPVVALAWFGVLGTPMLLLVVLLAGLPTPTWVGWVLVGWFVSGFGFLVARMPKGRDDGWDDGARL